MSNLRQLAEDQLVARGGCCRCIRCREAGHSAKKADSGKIELTHTVYEASRGTEDFIQAEDREADTLIGFVRLRIPSEPFRPELDTQTGLIRELHVYGRMVPVGERRGDAWQHRGWGEALMAEAEKAASERYDMRRMVVMSALGTKQYYARFGYTKQGVYVSKLL
jgi:elongator complex protein 3